MIYIDCCVLQAAFAGYKTLLASAEHGGCYVTVLARALVTFVSADVIPVFLQTIGAADRAKRSAERY
jgi:hypothetical protein